jgi:hypothetical protein
MRDLLGNRRLYRRLIAAGKHKDDQDYGHQDIGSFHSDVGFKNGTSKKIIHGMKL